MYYALCQGLSDKEQRKLCMVATLTSLTTMIVAMLTGGAVLDFFDISVDAFRIAGGILLLFAGINMVNSKAETILSVDNRGFSEIISVAVIPIAIPLTTGAGTISTIIVYAHTLTSWTLIVKMLVAILTMSGIIYLTFKYSVVILRLLGHTGMNVLTKLFGIITLALGIQFILVGLEHSFFVH